MSTNNPKVLFELRAYNTAELAKLYKVNYRTFNRWLKPHRPLIGERVGHMYTVNQVLIIINRLGLPGDLEFRDSNI